MELFLNKLKDMNIDDKEFAELMLIWESINYEEKIAWINQHLIVKQNI